MFNNVSEEDLCVYDPLAIKKRNGLGFKATVSVYLFLSFQFYVFPKIILGNSLECSDLITIYAPMIYTAPCIMFWMRAYPLRGEVGGGWALEFESFSGPVKWHRADRREPFWAPK